MKEVPLFDAKNRLSALVHGLESGGPVQITRHGKPVAVVVDSQSYDELVAEGRSFGSLYDRFVAEWPGDDGGDDPFDGVRLGDSGRDVNL